MRSKREPAKRTARIEQPTTTHLTLSDWQRTPALVTEGQKILANPAMKLALAMFKNDSPANQALQSGVDISERAIHQARTEGFYMLLNSFEALGTFITSDGPQIEADFGASEVVPELAPDMTGE